MKKEEKVVNETEETVEKKEAEKPEEKGGTHATGPTGAVSKVQPADGEGTVSKGVPAGAVSADVPGDESTVKNEEAAGAEGTVSKGVAGDGSAASPSAAKETPKAEEDLAAKWSGNIINKEWCENYLKNTTMGRITMICSVLLLICLAVLCVMTFIVMFRVRSA